jgi:hypothetical protein
MAASFAKMNSVVSAWMKTEDESRENKMTDREGGVSGLDPHMPGRMVAWDGGPVRSGWCP